MNEFFDKKKNDFCFKNNKFLISFLIKKLQKLLEFLNKKNKNKE